MSYCGNFVLYCVVFCRASSSRPLLLLSPREDCCLNSWYWEVAQLLHTSVQQHQGIYYQLRKGRNFHPSLVHAERSNFFSIKLSQPSFCNWCICRQLVSILEAYNMRPLLQEVKSYGIRFILLQSLSLFSNMVSILWHSIYLAEILLLSVHVGVNAC